VPTGELDRYLVIADPRLFCRTTSEVLGVTGVGVTLLGGARLVGQIGASDDVAVGLEWAEFALGEGPRAVAASSGSPVLEGDMTDAERRYPIFAPAARRLGANATFTFPIAMAGSVFATLSLYNAVSGDLSDVQVMCASLLADVALPMLLASTTTDGAGDIPDGLSYVGIDRQDVHIATGFVSNQLHISIADALGALRARAWAANQPLSEVCAAVIERRTRL